MRLSGSAFQILAAATEGAHLPTTESLKGGTMKWLVPEWRERRPDTSTTRLSGPRWTQILGCSATENFVGQQSAWRSYILLSPESAANVGILGHH